VSKILYDPVIGKIATLVGYDGTDFRVPRVTSAGYLVVAPGIYGSTPHSLIVDSDGQLIVKAGKTDGSFKVLAVDANGQLIVKPAQLAGVPKQLSLDAYEVLQAKVSHDGTENAYIEQDKQPSGNRYVRVTTPVDRFPSQQGTFLNADYTNHGPTVRWTYTVGANNVAIIQGIYGYVATPEAGKQVTVSVTVDGIYLFGHSTAPGAAGKDTMTVTSEQVWLQAGATVQIVTFSSDATSRRFQCGLNILQFTR
jgi:hypothetical protein